MRKVSYFTVLLFLTLTISSCERPTPPNIIYVLADDLGYGELGVHGQEII